MFLILLILFFNSANSLERYELPCNKELFELSLDTMKSQVGVKEVGKNSGKKVNEYQYKGGGKNGQAWCMYFQYWCFAVAYEKLKDCIADLKIPITRSGWSQQPLKDALKYGEKTDFSVEIGDLVVWRNTGSWSGHIGRVVKVSNAGWFYTIEGNTGNTLTNDGDGVYLKRRNYYHKIGRMSFKAFVGFNTGVK